MWQELYVLYLYGEFICKAYLAPCTREPHKDTTHTGARSALKMHGCAMVVSTTIKARAKELAKDKSAKISLLFIAARSDVNNVWDLRKKKK